MHPRTAPSTVLTAVVVVIALLVFVIFASIAVDRAEAIASLPPQAEPPTATPTQPNGSVAGSTDAIVWMGIVIALIVLAPMLLGSAIWARRP